MSAWPIVKLADVAKVDKKIVNPATLPPSTPYIGLEHIATGGQQFSISSIAGSSVTSSKHAFTDKHVLLGRLRPNLSKVVIPAITGVCSTDILPLAAGPRLDTEFLRYYFLRPQVVNWLSGRATGANLPRISPKNLAELPVLLPPLPEQCRIASVLSSSCRSIQQTRNALLTLGKLESSLVEAFFRRSAEWQWHSMEDIAEVRGGLQLTPMRSNHPIKLPYLRVANVLRGRLDLSEIKTIRVTQHESTDRSLRRGDLLIVEGHGNPAELGRCAIWDGSVDGMMHQNHIIRARIDANITYPRYVSSWLNSPSGRAIMRGFVKTTSGLNTLNISNVKSITLPIAPREEQDKLEFKLIDIAALRSQYHEQLNLAQELHDSLQYRAFRGEL